MLSVSEVVVVVCEEWREIAPSHEKQIAYRR